MSNSSVRLIRRYVWLIDTVRNAGKITLDEINRKWLDERSLRLEDEGEIPTRTFHRHREAIADIFGIDILCDRFDGNRYYIDSETSSAMSSFTVAVLNSLAIDNKLMNDKDISDRIVFEELSGDSCLITSIIDALIKKVRIKIVYNRFGKNPTGYTVEPYGLKQTGRRWYMIARIAGFDGLTVFALERIEKIEMTGEAYGFDDSFDIRSYFDEVVGVNLDDEYECEEVVVRVYDTQRNYIETLPLHKSQKLINRQKTYSDYSFRLRAEYEFQHEILKMGFNAEVLSPGWLRDEIRWRAREILKLYESK